MTDRPSPSAPLPASRETVTDWLGGVFARWPEAGARVDGWQNERRPAVLVLAVDPKAGPALEALRQAAQAELDRRAGPGAIQIVLTAERAAPPPAAAPRSQPQSQPPSQSLGGGAKPRPGERIPTPWAGAIIAVGSGKGGVGKSTVSVNLALALLARGLKVGLLDADIYGPSQGKLLGLTDRPRLTPARRIEPLQAHGLKVMSIGLVQAEDKAVIWRGPLVMGAVQQMLRDVEWGTLDVLIVDLPPGTGDAPLTLAQSVRLDGAVIVSTPQDLALLDARKAIGMFGVLGVPILGLVETMSYFCCPNCGHRTAIFGEGGVAAEAERLGVPVLAQVPLLPEIRALSDAGTPPVAVAPDGAAAQPFHALAARLAADLLPLQQSSTP